jgi:hypothetical protein
MSCVSDVVQQDACRFLVHDSFQFPFIRRKYLLLISALLIVEYEKECVNVKLFKECRALFKKSIGSLRVVAWRGVWVIGKIGRRSIHFLMINFKALFVAINLLKNDFSESTASG